MQGQLELFGTLLETLVEHDGEPAVEAHRIIASDGRQYAGSWEEILGSMRDARAAVAGQSLQDYMTHEARRIFSDRGIAIPTSDAESFIRGSAKAGLLRILR
jgi:hypothetical protein